MAANKLLSADRLFALVRAHFEQVPDQRAENAKISMPDALMSGLLACELFQAVLEKKGSRRRLWEHMRALFKTLESKSMAQLFEAILYGYKATVVIFSPP